MTDQELHGRLRTAMDHAAPDDLNGVLSRCQTRKGDITPMKQPHSAAVNRKKYLSWLTAACLVLALVGGGVGIQQANAVASVVSLDVNPSIQLSVNRSEKVLSCTPLNDEAVQVLGDMELKGTQLDVAVNAIVGSLLRHGYLDSLSSAILISVEDKNTDRAALLQQELTGTVDLALKNASANAAVLSQTITQDAGLDQQAQQHNISTGKAALVKQVMALNNKLEFEALAALSVEELKDLVETGAPAMPIGRDRAAYLAQEHAGLLASDAVTAGVDPELDDAPAHYEVDLLTPSARYEYRIDAYTGAVLSYVRQSDSDIGVIGSGSTTTAIVTAITADQAKKAALDHAGLTESQVTILKTKLDTDDGRTVYDVEFISGTTEYDYEIDAVSGAVWKCETETRGTATPGNQSQAGQSGASITADQAKKAALDHAGLTESQVTLLTVKQDYDDGRFEYEVDFWQDTTEYEYTIDGVTGMVLKYETDVHGNRAGGSQSASITADQAKKAALDHAGLTESQVTKLKVKLDDDDPYYEVEFKSGGMEYEYEISSSTGAVLSYERDWDD